MTANVKLEFFKDLLVAERGADGFGITRLCGMRLAAGGPQQVRGPAVLETGDGLFQGTDFACAGIRRAGDGFTARFRVAGTALEWRSVWRAGSAAGVVSRRDFIVNRGDTPATLLRVLARIALPAGRYEGYTQASRWCRENQGAWQPLHAGLRLAHMPGRTTEGATPYLALRRIDSEDGIVFHVLPRGNWAIRVVPVPSGAGSADCNLAVVELGPAGGNLRRKLAPGETYELPEILLQRLPAGGPHLAAPSLHSHLLRNQFAAARPEAPVVFNTWFDQFEILDVPRLRAQLAAAKEVGCEAFVIDAGWYGVGGPNWAAQVGNWREKTDAAFHGRMREFAGEVRAAGLGFGLWMEPERFGPGAPVRAQHPGWFVPVGDMARLDLERPAAYAWLRGEIRRLVRTYRLAWMKVDFNFALDCDASGAELAGYSTAWHRLLDEVRREHPGTFFEGCSSGALRGDLETLRHFDGHFLSDSANPTDMLRITQGAWLRLLPGRLTRWAVMRPAGQVLPRYSKSVADSPPVILAPCGATWESAESVDLDFALLSAMPGMFGLSGDIAGLAPGQRARIATAVAFYRRWRRLITGAVGHLLTPPLPLESREGWISLQLHAAAGDASLVFVYRLGNAGTPPALKLRGLDPARAYRVECGFAGEGVASFGGESLIRDGLPPSLLQSGNNSAQVFTVLESRGRKIIRR